MADLPEILEYDIIKADEHESFVKYLNNSLEDGWHPQGSMQIISGDLGQEYRYNQVLVKYKPTPIVTKTKTTVKD